MSAKDQIVAAIGAHGAWKRRLADAIATGKDASTPDKVRLDNQCDFGRWLYAADSAVADNPRYTEIKRLHAEFHREAAAVLGLALTGNKVAAIAAMGSGTPFARASSGLTTAMMAWNAATA